MTRLFRTAVAAAASAFAFAAASSATAQTSWDRRAEHIAIVSKPGDAVGSYRVSGAWAVVAANVSTLPLNTNVTLSRNGTAVWSETVNINATAGVLGGCNLCPSPNTCICAVPNGPCSCNSLWLTTSIPNAIPLLSGDVLKLTLTNGSGGVADTNTANDSTSLTFNGTPTFWNRRVLGAELLPSPCTGNPDLYDLAFSFAVDFSQLTGEIEFDSVLTLLVDDAVAMQVNLCNDTPWLTTGTNCVVGGTCNDDVCGSGSCAGANVQLHCQFVELFDGAIMSCACSSGQLNYVVPGVLLRGLTNNSVVKCTLAGNPASALPELPLLNGDNAIAVGLKQIFQPCPGDINRDGVVNGADLAEVLSAWGTCPQ